jgi:hypothetical protein
VIAGGRLGHLDQVALAAEQLEVADRTTNLSITCWGRHVNLGWPLWDEGARVETDAAEVRLRDEDAAPHDWGPAPPQPVALPERVWEHVGATRAVVVNERLGLGGGCRSLSPARSGARESSEEMR